MNISSIQLTLLIGKFLPLPASPELMNALQSIEITQSTTSGFQMTFLLQPGIAASIPGLNLDYSLITGPLLQPGSRVVIIATLNVLPRVLMDGIITHHQLTPAGEGSMSLSVTGEDISVMMDMEEIAMEYPGMGDEEIALFILARYAELGIEPLVIPPPTGDVSLPVEFVPQQNGTDRSYLRSLAQAHGYTFFIRPGIVPLQNIAYWGPVSHVYPPQKALTLNAGPDTNVETLSFSYDALSPTLVLAAADDDETGDDLMFRTFAGTRLPPLSSMPPLIFNQPFVRQTLLGYQGSSFVEAMALAQAITDQSLDQTITANGSLDVLRYGDIVTAPGLIGVRGAGFTYDGYYLVNSVTHQISPGQYKQSFSLSREGPGSTVPGVLP